MTIDLGHTLAVIAVCVACTFIPRALPFLLFGGREVPKIVKYLGRILPLAVMMTMVVYCLRGMTFDAVGNFLPQIIAVAVVVGLHLWRKNTFLSIVGGTVVYMLLVQVVF